MVKPCFLCHPSGSAYEKPKKSFLYVFLAKLPLSGFSVVLLLVGSWQLTRGVAAHSNTNSDSAFMRSAYQSSTAFASIKQQPSTEMPDVIDETNALAAPPMDSMYFPRCPTKDGQCQPECLTLSLTVMAGFCWQLHPVFFDCAW